MAIQQISTATSPPSTDFIRPQQTCELRQRPVLTSMPLVHTKEVTGSIPVSPTRLTDQLRPHLIRQRRRRQVHQADSQPRRPTFPRKLPEIHSVPWAENRVEPHRLVVSRPNQIAAY